MSKDSLETSPRVLPLGLVVWFTGRPAAGKSTLAVALQERLAARGLATFVLDGDILRQGLCADLGFSRADRSENIRRVGELAAILAKAGLVTIVAFISPYADDRDRARAASPQGRFLEVYLSATLEACESRDPKGNYAKARAGLIKGFTGIDDPYEPPQAPDLALPTHELTKQECLDLLEDLLRRRGLVP
jgi:adenylyl-sulfate kinase